MNVTIFTDGGARGNPGPAAIGVVVLDEVGNILAKKGKPIGVATNNAAEYGAVSEALHLIKDELLFRYSPIDSITFVLDSNLVVQQLNGIFKLKNANLRNHLFTIRSLEIEIHVPIYYTLVPREKNRQADNLVNKALDENRETLFIKG